MPDSVPVVSVSLANVAIESVLYGIFFVLNVGSTMLICFPLNGITCAKESISRRVQMAVKKPMFLGIIALFISITGHWICTVLRLFGAVVFSEGGPLAYYEDLSQDLYTIKIGFIEASLIIADSMLIYRLWMIWSRNYCVIIIPILTLIGLIVCGVGGTNVFAHYVPGQSVFSSVTQAWVISDGIFTLLTNVYSSTLIGYRIWWTRRESRYSGAVQVGSGNNLSSALAIFVESALLYTTWTAVFIATYATESRVESVIADCWAVVAGISFCLINVRIGLGWARNPSVMVSTIAARQQAYEVNMGETWLAYPMQPLAIHVHQAEDTSQMDSLSCSGVGGGPDSGTQKNESSGDA
ncbi:hypothetical protein Moror_3758 [Moniliophthora roreri MCA 2997]|uniref:Integral membrane protein n=2 Tax=Moniliophthora roreri TaxID=221103 RepID=V2WVR4_MONRO|nr:hypothetical protein Moror_3758 [Moniliophthora roreri MCA 2997]